ncbi:amidohydrolase family protein [Rhizobium anhuiense]|uniref:amidohydrolase family protein n=2 Tax=Rhizobium anhuiense TaxID=1184720 RepID=UPI0020CDED4E|nr:amidohydrolase family protein [Rhizobium anhuiense]UTS89018.1 amidohydrolase family protein [Rhizobium anhuiense bv. trifolii]
MACHLASRLTQAARTLDNGITNESERSPLALESVDSRVSKMKIIAIEEHVLPDQVKHAWSTIPGADDGTLGLNPGVLGKRLADMGRQRLALMDETGVDVQVLSLTTPGLNNLGRHGVDLARRVNDLLADTVAANPSRFQALAVLPSVDADAAAQELRRAVRELGCKGAILYGRVGEKNLDHAIFEQTFAYAAELGVPLLIHPQIPQVSVREAYYAGFAAPIDLALSTFGLGWHFEAGIQFVRIVLAGVFDRYPGLQVILGHWGELVIFYLERLAMLDRVSGLQRPFLDYVRNNLYLTASGMFSPAYLRQAIDAVGTDRILFSTDYPYQYRSGGEARRFVEGLELDDADKPKFAHRNWERLTGS